MLQLHSWHVNLDLVLFCGEKTIELYTMTTFRYLFAEELVVTACRELGGYLGGTWVVLGVGVQVLLILLYYS